jgi:hypothetical protein
MRNLPFFVLLTIVSLPALSGCANDHFFPRTRPLFVGLDESHVPSGARAALARAKVDFQLARHNEPPRYAKPSGPTFDSNTRNYQGDGYRIAIVHKEEIHSRSDGPEIFIDSKLTGGKPYHYDEVDEVVE